MFTAPAHSRAPRSLVVALAAVVGFAALTIAPAAQAVSRSVTIDDPAPVSAGQVELRGTVSSGEPQTTTVLYVVDNSGSTSNPAGLDCDGNGTAGEAGDDLNGDTSIGDPLDCEIGAVGSLNETLEASSGASVVSLETFASTAEAINLDPPTTPPVLFVAPGDKGAGSEPLLVTASKKLRRDPVAGTSFDPAVATALQTLADAPAGPKYIMFLSDGIGA
ncbi:MAG: hypothetical protein JWP10_434, partial [Nocardioidaceae bacterium]|nr:hypothetical protein [Nocardioidaceae bacterium]